MAMPPFAFTCALITLCTVRISAQSTVTGTVVDTNSNPIAGVSVSLQNNGASTYTDSLGAFTLTVGGTGSVRRNSARNDAPVVRFDGTTVSWRPGAAKNLSIEVFDLSGRSLLHRHRTAPSRSLQYIDLGAVIERAGIYLLDIRTGQSRWSLRLARTGSDERPVVILDTEPLSSPALARRLAAIDSIRISKRGFLPVFRAIESTPSSHPGIVLRADALEWRVDSLLSLMTTDEKAGQMLQASFDDVLDSGHVGEFMLGSIIASVATSESRVAGDWADRSDAMQLEASRTRLGIPLLQGTDAVHGHNNCKDAVIFPHNVALGCIQDSTLVEQAGAVTAMETAATGANWTFAPCIAVARSEQWGRTYESFGETAERAITMGVATTNGLQGAGTFAEGAVAACAKHYLADGGTVWGTGMNGGIDQGNAPLSIAQMRSVHFPGYEAAVRAGLHTIMCSYSSWTKPDTSYNEDMHGSHYWLTTVLKRELGFDGIVITDCNGHSTIELRSSFADELKEKVRVTINAGVDMIMGCSVYRQNLTDLKELIAEGEIPMSRIDDAVRRILRVKYRLGLFDNAMVDRAKTAEVGSAAHRHVARQCVRQSCVLLKNEGDLLPLHKSGQKIAVVGFHADSLEMLCGGWSMGWGGMVESTSGTTVLEGMRSLVDNTANIVVSSNGTDLGDADVAVVVSGEQPTAEWFGDARAPVLPSWTRTMIDNCVSAGKPVVLVLISGRPLLMRGYQDSCDAVLAAWLPGTESNGVADVLFGDYNPTGALAHSWPREATDIPINVGDAVYDPLWPYGFGLSY